MLYKVFYSDFFVPNGFSGWTVGPVIFIRPSKKDDIGLLEHEKTHVRQFWRNPFTYCRVLWNKKFVLETEVEAYKEQLKWCSEDRMEYFANSIATKYGLNITKEQALELLKQ